MNLPNPSPSSQNVLRFKAFLSVLIVTSYFVTSNARRLRADDPPTTLKAGIIGFDAHALAWTRILNASNATGELAEMTVVAGFPGGSPDIPQSMELLKKQTQPIVDLGVEVVDSIDELIAKVDVVMILSIDGRKHLEQVKPVFAARKPVFIDKPIAASLADAIRIFNLAKKYQTPCFTSSALRFSNQNLQLQNNPGLGNVLACDQHAPCTLEPHHPDLFWYGIHGVEPLFTIMGSGCRSVSRLHTEGTDFTVGVWKEGRIGTFRGIRDGKRGYGATVFGTKGIRRAGGFEGYEPLLREIIRFFKTSQPPVTAEQTLEIFAFMQAAEESKLQSGRPVLLESVMKKAREEARWETVSIPSEQNFKGEAWYRTWFKPHKTFFNKHERDLYGESIVVNIRDLPGAHEVYINGKAIGGGGSFPPNFMDGRDGNHRHKIPSGSLQSDQWNELAIRVYSKDTQAGFLSEPPFVMNYFWECVLEGKWEFLRGTYDPSALGGPLPSRPSTSFFDQFQESNRVLGEAANLVHGRKLPADKSLEMMQTEDDLVVDLMLAEPLVAQPTHFSFDARGRLWVSQYRQYPYPAGLKMISRDRYYRSHYDKTPPAPPNHDRGRDVISIHEDTDGDGRYDHHKVFRDGLNMANAALPGRGGVWVMHTPYLLFYPDKDGDDIPDGPPVVHLQGFGMEDTHSVANGLAWGMDGWLYGAQGSTTSCHVTRPDLDAPDAPGVYFQGCMVWRYHPETRRFEIFAEGGGNNFGLEIDSGGRIFTGNNGGKTRGWHYLQGGLHLMQGTTPNKFGPVRNPFAFGDLPKMTSEQDIPRFTHFATFVESTAIPPRYQRTFFSVEPLHNFVIASQRSPRGATFETSDISKVLTSDDFAFRPVYIGNAPDGSVLVADFYEHYIAHGQHYQSQIDPTTGRIFRLRGKESRLEQDVNLRDKTSEQLISLLSHPNRWHRQTAIRLLGERREPGSRTSLQQLIRQDSQPGSLEALWALYQGFGLDQETAFAALEHENPMVRYWAVRLICDDVGFAHKRRDPGLRDSLGPITDGPDRVDNQLFSTLLRQATREPDAEVRSQFAASARRLPYDQAMSLVAVCAEHRQDVDDPYIPLLCWWVIEHHLDRNREAVMQLFEDASFRSQPMVVSHLLSRLMRALALKGKSRDLKQCTWLLESSKSQNQIDALLTGFEQAYAGRRMTGLPQDLAKALVDSGRSSLELRLRLGDADAAAAAIQSVAEASTASETRLSLVRALGEIRPEGSLSQLIRLAIGEKNVDLQRAALTATSAFNDPMIAKTFLDNFDDFSDEVRPALFSLVLSRTEWTRELLNRLSSHSIATSSLPADVVEQLRLHSDEAIATSAAELLGVPEVLGKVQYQQQIRDVRDAIAEGTGNPYAGEKHFIDRCSACHKLFHKGGQVGPDLTPYQRGNLDTLLTSVINPSAEIREGFENIAVLTSEGRILTGFVTDEDTQIVTLRVRGGESIRIERDEIETMKPVGRSLMPEKLLDGMTEQQLRDFFAYLRISQPISN